MSKRVFIIHGYNGSSERGWKRWLADRLREKGYEVHAPAMPTPYDPDCDEWVRFIRDLVGDPRKDDVLVGHSLGTIALLRYLESLPPGQRVDKTILVASFGEAFGKPEEQEDISTFVRMPINWQAVRNACTDFSVIHSEDDDVVPLECGKDVTRNLGVEPTVVNGYGHFSFGDGVLELPLVLERILPSS